METELDGTPSGYFWSLEPGEVRTNTRRLCVFRLGVVDSAEYVVQESQVCSALDVEATANVEDALMVRRAVSSDSAPEPRLRERSYQFINESLRNSTRSEAEGDLMWVFAISNIAQGLELLLKERLRVEHPVLVYSDVDKGRQNTVSFFQAIQRLERCGVLIEKKDRDNIAKARDLRNALVHFAPEVSGEQLRAAYITFFEFTHAFHLDQLGEELHPYVDESLWEAEGVLMEEFERDFVQFQGATVISRWPIELIQSQFFPIVVIKGKKLRRLTYGEEVRGRDFEYPRNCHDCAATAGQFHGPGCDVEQCPNCGRQFISCDCEVDWMEELDAPVSNLDDDPPSGIAD